MRGPSVSCEIFGLTELGTQLATCSYRHAASNEPGFLWFIGTMHHNPLWLASPSGAVLSAQDHGVLRIGEILVARPPRVVLGNHLTVQRSPWGASCLYHHPERMEITQPRVARHELPWEPAPKTTVYPERVISGSARIGGTVQMQPSPSERGAPC